MGINRDKVLASASKLLQNGKFEKAITEFQKLVEDDPKDVRTLLKIGDTYVKMGRRAEAISSYERVATLYSEQGFFLKAVAVFKQMLRVDASLPRVHLQLAELYQQLGLTSDCLQHYQQVTLVYEQQGRNKDALQILKRMVDLEPDNLPSRIKLAELFAQQGLGAEAIAEFRSAASYLKAQERFDDFVRVAERLTYFDPSALDVTQELAQLYMQRGEPKAALSKLQLCFKADPRNLETLALIGRAFLEMQQVPKTVSVYKEMARIYEANGQPDEGRAQWGRVLELDPDDAEAKEALHGPPAGLAPVAAPQASAPVAASVAPVAPPPAQSFEDEQIAKLLTETDVFVKYGLPQKAVEHLQKVFALRPDHLEAHAKLLALYKAAGDSLAVVSELRVVVQLAYTQDDPRSTVWQAELEALSAPAAREDEVVPLDEQDDLLIDPSLADEPPLVDEEPGALPSDEALVEEVLEDALRLDAPAMPTFDDGSASPAVLDIEGGATDEALSLDEADALVRQALAGIEGLDDLDGSGRAGAPLPIEEPLGIDDPAAFDEPFAGAVSAAPDELSGDEMAAHAAAELDAFDAFDAGSAFDGTEAGEPVASTAIMSLSSAEMDEIREFLGSASQATRPELDAGAFSTDEAGTTLAKDGLELAHDEGEDDFNDPTLATEALPQRQQPLSSVADLPSLPDEGEAGQEMDLDAVAAAATRAALEGNLDPVVEAVALPIAAAEAAEASVQGASSSEVAPRGEALAHDASQLALPSLDAEAVEELPRELTGVRKTGKLGLADRAIGFENDPASSFFPDELEEAEFFIQQDILDEAREILEFILEDVPESERVAWMLARVDAKENGEPEPPAPWEQRIIDEVAAEISDLSLELAEPDEPQQVSVDEVLSQFKKGVAETVHEDDADTHYNLGIAFREMGLYHDAISEFRLAARAPSKEPDAQHLIGLTLADLGEHEEALEAFTAALSAVAATQKQQGVNHYQRSVCLEALARPEEALAALELARALGADMADLEPRIARLGGEPNLSGEAGSSRGSDDASPRRRKNIGYV